MLNIVIILMKLKQLLNICKRSLIGAGDDEEEATNTYVNSVTPTRGGLGGGVMITLAGVGKVLFTTIGLTSE